MLTLHMLNESNSHRLYAGALLHQIGQRFANGCARVARCLENGPHFHLAAGWALSQTHAAYLRPIGSRFRVGLGVELAQHGARLVAMQIEGELQHDGAAGRRHGVAMDWHRGERILKVMRRWIQIFRSICSKRRYICCAVRCD